MCSANDHLLASDTFGLLCLVYMLELRISWAGMKCDFFKRKMMFDGVVGVCWWFGLIFVDGVGCVLSRFGVYNKACMPG